MHDYKLIIFDWDGTLMDSIGRIVSSMQVTAKIVGFDIPSHEQIKNTIGISLTQGLDILFPERSQSQEKAFIAEYQEQYRTKNHVPTQLFADAKNILAQLEQDNKLLAVATGKGRQGLNRVLTETSTQAYFHTTYSANDARSKPDPQMLYSILDELKVSADHAVMIGDTVHDMEMAKRAGIDRIGVSYGVHNEAQLQAYQPKAVVNSLAELQQLLSK